MSHEYAYSARAHALLAALGSCAGRDPVLTSVKSRAHRVRRAEASHAAGLLGRSALGRRAAGQIKGAEAQAEVSHAAGLLGRSALFSSDEMIQGDVLRTMLDLICSLRHKSQLAGLGVLAGLAMTSAEAAIKLLSRKLHQVCVPQYSGHSSLAATAPMHLRLADS